MNVRPSACVAFFVCLGLAYSLAGPAFAAPRKATAHTYVVRAGDGGWWRIAQAHGVTLSQLLAANHATAAAPLRVGQTVTLPAQAHELKTPKAPGKVSVAPKSAVATHKRVP
jgi:LysM repeat protein